MSFVRGSNPIWSFVDLIGQQLDDSYYISFLSNTFPYLPQLVTHDNQGLVPWSQPIEFLANGTLPPDIFGDPNLVYRLEVRQGPTQFDPLINVVNNYVFGQSQGTTGETAGIQDNQISNSQFAIVNFIDYIGNPATPDPQIIFTAAGTYEIAPDWFIILTGSGTCTITQFISNGAQNTPSSPSPPYWLEFQTIGWTSVILQQRLSGNGALWYNNYVAATILARSNDSIPHPISLTYVPNTPGAPVPIILSTPLTVSGFTILEGVASLFPPTTPISINTTANNLAYVNIQISLPTAGTVDISNIQLYGIENIGQLTAPTPVVQPEETIERQMDHLAHYYDPKLAFKPIPSWLVGWDFPLNPTQNGSTVSAPAIGANKSQYYWDSTIIFQSANSGIAVTRGTQNGLQLGASATSQAAVIQYIELPSAQQILRNNMAVNMVAGCAAATTIKGTISLWYTKSTLPNVAAGTNNSLVATLDANGKPATFNGTWFEVPLKTGQEAQFTLTPVITEFSFPFWKPPIESEIEAATFIAIVIGFQSIPMGTISPEIISCSLNSGDIATIPPADTFGNVFNQCQFFYEKSYDNNVAPGTSTFASAELFNGTIYNNEVAPVCKLFPNQMNLEFKQLKRKPPALTVWSTDGTINTIYAAIRLGATLPGPSFGTNPTDAAISIWDVTNITTKNAIFSVNTGTGGNHLIEISTVQEAAIGEQYFHYVADARLGIV